MKILVDANIYLRFYGNPLDKRGALDNVAELGMNVIFPDQVWREFMRNRGTLLAEALARFVEPTKPSRPAFLEGNEQFKELEKDFQTYKASIIKMRETITRMTADLSSDPLWRTVKAVYDSATKLPVTNLIIDRAHRRMLRGDPPMTKEKKSIGDEIIWETLLDGVDDDLVLVSRDNTFSTHTSFLVDEFGSAKDGKKLIVVDRISEALRKLGDADAARKAEADEAATDLTTIMPLQGTASVAFAAHADLRALYGTPCPRCKKEGVGLDPANLSRCIFCGFLSDDD